MTQSLWAALPDQAEEPTHLPVDQNLAHATWPSPAPTSEVTQMQHRLLQMNQQLAQMQAQMEQLAREAQTSGEQVTILTRHLTTVQPLQGVHDQIATLATQLAANQEQLEQLTRRLQGVADRDQVAALTQMLTQAASQEQVGKLVERLQSVASHEQIDALTQTLARTASQEQLEKLVERLEGVAGREQIEALTQTLARTASQEQMERLLAQSAPREQVERLLQVVANQEQLGQLEETFKRLSRTQFKANTLGETKEQQLQSALATLQDLATQRTRQEEAQTVRSAQQVENAKRSARAELAAEFLPALDSLELALEHGATLLQRQQSQTSELSAQQQRYVTQLEGYWEQERQQISRLQQAQQTAAPGFWQRLFGANGEAGQLLEELPTPPQPISAATLHETLQQAQSGLQAWLSGLQLVYERAAALLASEEITPIEALHKPFDPRLHVAVSTAERNDLEPNRVVQVIRKGYRQRERVLRYAEVVVSRQPVQKETL